MTVSLPAYPHRLAGHCASGAFRDLFEYRGYRHAGAPLSEAMVFGLGAGLDLMYLPRPGHAPPLYLGGRGAGLEESLLSRIGGTLTRRAEPDDTAAWAWVQAKLDRGEPVPMVGDCQKLEYLRTRTSMPQHVFVVTGYDDTHALVADNDRAEIQRCSFDSLREARRARGFPLPAMNVTFEIDWPASLPPLETLVPAAIAQSAAWLRAPSGWPTEAFGRDTFGQQAMARLEHNAAQWSSTPPAPRETLAQLVWIYIEKAGTGGGFFRRLYRDFLGEAQALLPSAALADAHRHYAALADGWTEAGTLAGAGRFEDASAALVRLARAEQEGIALLERVAREQGAA
jgi:hypothetical protein